MKIFYLLLCCCLTTVGFAQTQEPKIVEYVPVDEEIYEQEAEFPGGIKAMYQFIAENIAYPEDAVDQGLYGKVYVQFVVEKDGSLTDVMVVKGVSDSIDEEARRIVRAMPKWTPAMKNDEPMRCRYTLPLSFRLE